MFPPPTVGFWQRRRCLETLVHRWGAEHALGVSSPLDPVLAADGVGEVFDTMAPRQIELDRVSPPEHAVRLTATDSGSSWVWGPGEPVAIVSATSAELMLMLMLWGRVPSSDQATAWQGDRLAGRPLGRATAIWRRPYSTAGWCRGRFPFGNVGT
ncbi:MAG: maleylpyruvate isomerase family mycothiol-dependent enzyme [Dermatophilaceae bacterium]